MQQLVRKQEFKIPLKKTTSKAEELFSEASKALKEVEDKEK